MISKISIVGLGAIGCAYINQIIKTVPIANVSVIADGERGRRYSDNGVTINGQKFRFKIVGSAQECDPADLLFFGVKFNQFEEALEAARNHVGPNTIILSLLNGITSEEIIGRRYGLEKVLYSATAGIDAMRVGDETISNCLGTTYFGEQVNRPGAYSEKVLAVKEFFDRTGIGYSIPEDMMKMLWWKFMLNVGVNQVSAVLRAPYGVFAHVDEARALMMDAMREVVELSRKTGINLGQEDIDKCLGVIDNIAPLGKTSMCQDVEASRQTEVNIFAGTVVELGRKYDLPTPVNSMLLREIKALEGMFRYKASMAQQ